MFYNRFVFSLTTVIIITLNSYFIPNSYCSIEDLKTCKPLEEKENVIMSCPHEKLNKTNINCQEKHVIGTIMEYKCKDHYKPYEGRVADQIGCGQDGLWVGLKKFELFSCVEECGRRSTNPKPLGINFAPTNVSEWPWHAAIFSRAYNSKKSKTPLKYKYGCGGTLIRNSVILTAAHCVTVKKGNEEHFDPVSFRVVLKAIGTDFDQIHHESREQTFNVTNIYVNPHFNPLNAFQDDIAIMHLSGHVEFTNEVRPACIPNDFLDDQEALKDGKIGNVVGFGKTENKTTSASLRHGLLEVISKEKCFHDLDTQHLASQFCASAQRDNKLVTVCEGDSGGGLTFLSTIDGRYFVRGIVSNTKVDTGDILCRRHGVFTRVMSYFPWIRDIMEEIQKETIKELATRTPYPYIQRGTEFHFAPYASIPRVLEERITSIELLYVNLDPEEFLKSIDRSRHIKSLDLSHVHLSAPFDSRVYLPRLKSVHIDIPTHDLNFTVDTVQSFLFFDTDTSQHVELYDIFNLNLDIEIIVGNDRLIETNQHDGRLVLTGIDDCTRVFTGNWSPTLSQVYLRDCKLNISEIIERQHDFGGIKSFNWFYFSMSQDQLSHLVRLFGSLEDLTLIKKYDPADILINDIPQTLKRLALDGSVRISHDTTKPNSLPELEYFCCKFCQMNEFSLMDFPKIFPKVKFVIFETTQDLTINLKILQNMEHLEWIYINTLSGIFTSGLSPEENANVDNRTINQIRVINGNDENDGKLMDGLKFSFPPRFLLKVKDGLTLITSDTLIQPEIKNMEYLCKGFKHFYTSEEEYFAGRRLTTFELEAAETGRYKFVGSRNLKLMKDIPISIQPNLESIDVSDAEVSPQAFSYSLTDTSRLESISLERIKMDGGFFTCLRELPYELPEGNSLPKEQDTTALEIYKLNRVVQPIKSSSVVDVLSQTVLGLRSLIPLKTSCSDASVIPLKTPYLDASGNVQTHLTRTSSEFFQYLSQTRLQLVELRNNDEIILSVNFSTGSIIAQVPFINDLLLLPYLNESRWLGIKFVVFEPTVLKLREGVDVLILHIKYECSESQKFIRIQRPFSIEWLPTLRELTIVAGDSKLDLPLTHLENSTQTLEFLSLSMLKLHFMPGIQFERLNTLFLQNVEFYGCRDCFVENFLSTSPVRELVLISYYIWGLKGDITNEDILLQFLNSTRTLTLVKAFLGFDESSRIQQQILNLIPSAAVIPMVAGNKRILVFIIKKTSAGWVHDYPEPLDRHNVVPIFQKFSKSFRNEIFGRNDLGCLNKHQDFVDYMVLRNGE